MASRFDQIFGGGGSGRFDDIFGTPQKGSLRDRITKPGGIMPSAGGLDDLESAPPPPGPNATALDKVNYRIARTQFDRQAARTGAAVDQARLDAASAGARAAADSPDNVSAATDPAARYAPGEEPVSPESEYDNIFKDDLAPTDALRRAGSGLVRLGGEAVSGMADASDSVTRLLDRLSAKVGMRGAFNVLMAPSRALGVTSKARSVGGAVEGIGDTIDVATDKRDSFQAKVAESVGMVGGAVLLSWTGGSEAAGTAFIGQGFDSMAKQVKARGGEGTVGGDVATLSGGAVMGLLANRNVQQLLDYAPPAVRHSIADGLIKIMSSAGRGAALGAATQISNNIALKLGVDPDQDVFEGVGESAAVLGVTDGILHVMTGKLRARRGGAVDAAGEEPGGVRPGGGIMPPEESLFRADDGSIRTWETHRDAAKFAASNNLGGDYDLAMLPTGYVALVKRGLGAAPATSSFRNPEAPGIIEQANAAAAPTAGDESSPLDTDLIAKGRAMMAGAVAKTQADAVLDRNNAPRTGAMVELGGKRWTVEDAFTDPGGEDGLTLSRNGQHQKVYFSDLADAGIPLKHIPDPREDPLGAAVVEATGQPLHAPAQMSDASGHLTTTAAPVSGREQLKARIRRVESVNGEKNPLSSASGPFQFTDDTFNRYYSRVYGGLPPASARNDPAVQDRLMNALTGDNEAALKKAGFTPTAGNLYLAHFAGAQGAINLLRNPAGSAETILGAKVARSNPTIIPGKTAAEVIAWADRKMGGEGSPSGLGTPRFHTGEPAEPETDDQFDFLHNRLLPQRTDEAAAAAPASALTDQQKTALAGEPVDMATTRGQPTAADLEAEHEAHNAALETAAATVNEEPSDAQKEAGNYQKGHVRLHGLDITIETPRGVERSGTDPNGKAWSVEMPDHYGYVKRTTGADGEQVDVYIGPRPASRTVFVVDQNDANTGRFDEHKAMLGYESQGDALTAYRKAFSDGRADERVGHVTTMSVEQFKEWLATEQTAPAKETAQQQAGEPPALVGKAELAAHTTEAANVVPELPSKLVAEIAKRIGDGDVQLTPEELTALKAAGVSADLSSGTLPTHYRAPILARANYEASHPEESPETESVSTRSATVSDEPGAPQPQDSTFQPITVKDGFATPQAAGLWLRANKLDGEKVDLGDATGPASRYQVEAADSGYRVVDMSGNVRGTKVADAEVTQPESAPARNQTDSTGGVTESVTPPAEKPPAFDPQPHVEALRSFVANPRNPIRNVDRIAKHLGVTKPQAQRVLGAYVAQPNSGLFVSKKGNVRRLPRREGPVSLLHFLKDRGGIQAPKGHNLTSSKATGNVGARDLHKAFPGLISREGMPFDEAFRTATEAGYFGAGRDTGEVTENHFLQALDRAGEHYRPEDEATVRDRKMRATADTNRDFALREHRSRLDEAMKDPRFRDVMPKLFSETDKRAIVDIMAEEGGIAEGDPFSAAFEHYTRQMTHTLDRGAEETGDDSYDIPFEGAPSREAAQGDSEGRGAEAAAPGGRPEGELGNPRAGPEAGTDRGANDGHGRVTVDHDVTENLSGKVAKSLNAYNDFSSNFSSSRLKEFEDTWHPISVSVTSVDHFASDSKGNFWVIDGDDGSGLALLVPGPEVIRKWELFYRSMDGLAARNLLKQFYEIGNDTALNLREGAVVIRSGNGWRLKAKGRFNGAVAAKIEQTDMFGTRAGDERRALERAGDGRLKSDTAQKAAGADGGLFDARATQTDIENVTPIGQARAALQQAMTALDAAESRKPEPTGRIEDAGEKIGGARKDRWAERGMTVDDLADMTKGEAFQLVTKDAVWPKPDYAAMVEAGTDPKAAAGVKLLRDSLSAKPRDDSDQGRRDYIEMMQAAREILGAVRTVDDLKGVQRALYDRAGIVQDMAGRASEEAKAARRRLFSIFKGSTARLTIDGSDRMKMSRMVNDGFPAKIEPWKRQFEVRDYNRLDPPWHVVRKRDSRRMDDGHATKEEAEAAAKTAYEAQSAEERGKPPERPHLDRIERTGADVRNGRDIDSRDFIDDFGFRGVEYGNWVAGDERQTSTNLAYEALHDLANTLGVSPRALSLGGQLGIAFGARGSGRAAAHYEPGKLVINLTKLSGAGSLAHEWGHALDHYFGTLDTDLGTRGAPKGASGWYDKAPSRLVALGNLRPEMASAFDRLMDTIFKRDRTRAETVRHIEQAIEKLQAGVARQREAIERAKARAIESPTQQRLDAKFIRESETWITANERSILTLGERLAEAKDETKPLIAAKVETSFYANAKALSGKSGEKGYWARPTELFARSFESYVHDRLKAGGNVSQYLVQGVEPDRYAEGYAGNPYPTGAEREAINAAYDDLFRTMNVREDVNDRPLYSLAGSGEEVFYSALERAIEKTPTKRASAAQWAATLGRTPGVKKDELEWSGVFDWLDMQEGPVEKDALLGVVRDGGIQVDEVMLGNADGNYEVRRRAIETLMSEGRSEADAEAIYNEHADHFGFVDEGKDAQFQSWSSDPSNGTYRELLITLPRGDRGNPEHAPATHWSDPEGAGVEAVVAHARFMEKRDAEGRRVLFVEEVQSDWHQKGRDEGYEQTTTPKAIAYAEAEMRRTIEARKQAADEARPLAKSAMEAGGAVKLAIERMLEGPEFGVQAALERYVGSLTGQKLERARAALESLQRADLAMREADQQLAQVRSPGGIPEAPFKSTWPALVMKRVIRYAVDHGFERVAWTTGDEQAARYQLDKYFEKVELRRSAGGIGQPPMEALEDGQRLRFVAYQEGGGLPVVDTYVESRNDLEQYLPAGVAERLWSAEPKALPGGGGWRDAVREVSGLQLRTGGEGMRAFYDRNLVNITNDILKKTGAKVETVDIPGRDEPEWMAAVVRRYGEGSPEHRQAIEAQRKSLEGTENPGFTITPELAEAASGGFPLFDARNNATARAVEADNRRGGLLARGELPAPRDFEALAAEWRPKLQAALKQLGIDDRILANVVDRLEVTPNAAGSYYRRVISVALAVARNPVETFNHEAIHALRALGVFRPAEWAALQAAARADDALMNSVRTRYEGQRLNDDQVEEEAIADLYSRWSAGRAAKGFIARAFQRIADLFKAIRAAFRGVDAESVFRDIEGGRIGERETGEGTRSEETQGPLLSIVDGEEDATPTMSGLLNRTMDAVGRLKETTRRDQAALLADDIRIALQDRLLPGLRAEQAAEKILGRALTEQERPYLQEELMTGRVGAALEKLTDHLIEPLFDAMKEHKVTVDELESYLYARHAPERNERIAEINPDFADGGGSGMTDVEAAAIMARIEKSGRMDVIRDLAAKVDAIRDFGIDYRVETGLLSKKQVEEWRSLYDHYVPLRGFAEQPDEFSGPSDSRGIAVRGPESKRAFGRRSMAADLLAHTIMQAEEAIVRGQKNLVGQAFYNLAKEAKDDDFWKLHKVTVEKVVNPETGLIDRKVHTQLSPGDEAYTVFLKVDGAPKRVTMNRSNPAARRLAAAMRRLDETKMNGLLRVASKLNRYLSAVNTSLNPEFVITNAFRDLQEATANMAGLDIKHMIRGTLRDYLPAMRAALKGSFRKESGEWGRWWREFNDAGGRVYYNQVRDIPDLRGDIAKKLRRLVIDARGRRTAGDMAVIVKSSLGSVLHFIEAVNLGVENSIRLAAYKNAREGGLSESQAASLAKNLTVNFNRRGSWSVAINALYLFYNASIQGSTRVMLAMRSRRVRHIVYGMVASGVMLDLMNRMISGKDKDGQPFYEKISDFEKSRNLIIMDPHGSSNYLKLPLPWGYSSFFTIGRTFSEAAHGRKLGTAFSSLASAIVDAFNPIGGNNSFANFISPTITDPIIDLERNRDFADRPIMPDQPKFGPPVPDHLRYWNSVRPHWKAVTEFLNTASGGDKVVPGAVDVSPETLEYLFGVTTGAAGAFYDRLAGLGGHAYGSLTGDPNAKLDRNDIPFYRKLVGTKQSHYDRAAFYKRTESIQEVIHQAKEYRDNGDREGLEKLVAREGDVLSAVPAVQAAQKAMRKLNKAQHQLDMAQSNGKLSPAEYKAKTKELKDRETELMNAFNAVYLNTVHKPLGPSD